MGEIQRLRQLLPPFDAGEIPKAAQALRIPVVVGEGSEYEPLAVTTNSVQLDGGRPRTTAVELHYWHEACASRDEVCQPAVKTFAERIVVGEAVAFASDLISNSDGIDDLDDLFAHREEVSGMLGQADWVPVMILVNGVHEAAEETRWGNWQILVSHLATGSFLAISRHPHSWARFVSVEATTHP